MSISTTYRDTLLNFSEDDIANIISAIARRIADIERKISNMEDRTIVSELVDNALTQKNLIGGMIDDLEERVAKLKNMNSVNKIRDVQTLARRCFEGYRRIMDLLPTRIGKRVHKIDSSLVDT